MLRVDTVMRLAFAIAAMAPSSNFTGRPLPFEPNDLAELSCGTFIERQDTTLEERKQSRAQ